MAKFNEVQKLKRAAIAERKRAIHGDPLTKKLKNKPQPLSISGKRKRKLFKKQRREQKEKEKEALMSMQVDIEMAESHPTSSSRPNNIKFNVKKSKPLKLRRLKRQGNGKEKKSSGTTDQPDSMIE